MCDRTRYCGAYWGFGFHEDGVVSALRVCERFGESPVTAASCVYEGSIRHRRHAPVEHGFRYPLFLMYVDLDELPELLRRPPGWSARRPAPARFRRADYLGDPRGRCARRCSTCSRPEPAAGRTGRCGC